MAQKSKPKSLIKRNGRIKDAFSNGRSQITCLSCSLPQETLYPNETNPRMRKTFPGEGKGMPRMVGKKPLDDSREGGLKMSLPSEPENRERTFRTEMGQMDYLTEQLGGKLCLRAIRGL